MREALYFTAPRTVERREEPPATPGTDQVRVRSLRSAISAGTETLIYEGDAPERLPADETIDALETDLSYPVKYGYATVGRVVEVGDGVDDEWLDRRVFAYNPHETEFAVDPEELLPVPPAFSTDAATLVANVETAVTLALDGEPAVGERVVVFGQGVVGLLTTALLSRYPLEALITVDCHENRRALSERLGADAAVEPRGDSLEVALEAAGGRADLAYELTGRPAVLNDAVEAVGYDGRVIVGSWYGTRTADVDLGGRFHRDRISVESSQVSTIAPVYTGRWDRDRRHRITLDLLADLPAETLLTHRVSFERAADAYELVADRPDEAVGVVLTYGEDGERDCGTKPGRTARRGE